MNTEEALEKKEIISSLMEVIGEYNRLVPELLEEIENLKAWSSESRKPSGQREKGLENWEGGS